MLSATFGILLIVFWSSYPVVLNAAPTVILVDQPLAAATGSAVATQADETPQANAQSTPDESSGKPAASPAAAPREPSASSSTEDDVPAAVDAALPPNAQPAQSVPTRTAKTVAAANTDTENPTSEGDNVDAADSAQEEVTTAGVSQPAGDNVSNDAAKEPRSKWLNLQTNTLLGVVLVVLGIASLVGRYLRRQPSEYVNPALVKRFRQRLHAWWLMCAILVFGLLLQPIGTVILFGLISFWALREFITMAPTRRGDHRALFWALIMVTPAQYVLIALERGGFSWRLQPIQFYELYSIMIPVYATLWIPARVALSGDPKRFLERSAQITFGLLICVYCLSFAPALVNLQLASSDGTPWAGSTAGLLFYLILMSQLSDILQWTWGHMVGKRVIAPEVSTSRTWEGFAGGTLSTGLIGAALCWVTPFRFWEAACMSMVIGVMGMFGGMTMSAIKRDRGVNDYGSLVLGHAGVLDRIDTLCFAAPVFFHLTRFFFTM